MTRVSAVPPSNANDANPAISQLEVPVLGNPPLLPTTVVSGIVSSGMISSSMQSTVTANE